MILGGKTETVNLYACCCLLSLACGKGPDIFASVAYGLKILRPP